MRLRVISNLPAHLVAAVAFGLSCAAVTVHANPEADAALPSRLGAAARAIDGDPRRAQDLLAGLESSSEPVTDYVLYFQGRASRLLGDDVAARDLYERALAARPSSPIALKAAAELAPLLLAAGQSARIVELARAHAGDASLDSAIVALAAGKALADAQPRQAAQWLMRARHAAPGSAPGSEAVSLLSDLRRFSPDVRPATAGEMLEEARLAGREGDRLAQAALLDAILSRHAGDAAAPDAALARARLIAAENSRLEAAAWLEERAERAPTARAKSRLLFAAATDRWNMDDTARARAVFERVTVLEEHGIEAQRARYALGRIDEAEGRLAGAAIHYRRAAAGPDREVARESRWRAGWVAYAGGEFEVATGRFVEIANDAAVDDAAREEALYWQARSLERSGERPRAELLYRAVLERFPDGFYAYLAEQRSGASAPPPTVESLAQAEGISSQSRTAIQRAEVLSAAGLHDFAVDELHAAAEGASVREQFALLPVFSRLGAYAQALQTALALYRRGDMTEEQLYPFLYPHAYADIVVREASARGIDPYLVYSLIRQESLFDRRAASPASAYGLMQLLTSTARRMAGDDPVLSGVARDDLFEPEVNIRLGVAYLAYLAERFDRDPALMLAGYNAGEQAAERWRTRLAGVAPDEFIEQISYRETRDYVKKVLRNYRNYRRLYGDVAGARIQSAQ